LSRVKEKRNSELSPDVFLKARETIAESVGRAAKPLASTAKPITAARKPVRRRGKGGLDALQRHFRPLFTRV